MVAGTLEEGFEYSWGIIVSKACITLDPGEVEKRMQSHVMCRGTVQSETECTQNGSQKDGYAGQV